MPPRLAPQLRQPTTRLPDTIRWPRHRRQLSRPMERALRICPFVLVVRLAEKSAAAPSRQLIKQGDGNLVLYSTTRSTWNSATQNNPGAFAVMQGDGNFVVYTANWRALWNSATQGNAGAWLVMQADGNLVIYTSSGRAIWHRP